MLTHNERVKVQQQLLCWPKRQAHRFMHTLTPAVVTERKALTLLRRHPRSALYMSPEVALAVHRETLTLAGVETAFRDLSAFCRQRGYIYLELLENNPEFLATLMVETHG